MKVLGVDPGSECTGWGVVDDEAGKLNALAWGTIRPRAAVAGEGRLIELHHGLRDVLETWRPEAAAVEAIFHAVNPRSALQLGHTRGVLLLTLQLAGLPPASYAPTVVKKSLTGFGRAGKEQVREMVRLLLDLRGVALALDASDALAVACCHARVETTRRRLMIREGGA